MALCRSRLILLVVVLGIEIWLGITGVSPLRLCAQNRPLPAVPERGLIRAEGYLRAFQNDSALVLTGHLLNVLKAGGQFDTPFGLRVRLAEATALEQDEQEKPALEKLLTIAQASKQHERWETHARACLVLALVYEKNQLKERSWEQLSLSQADIEQQGLDWVYPYFAIRRSSWENIYGQKKAALFFAKEALRTAPHYGLVLEEAISHMLLNMLLPASAVDERMRHCVAAVRLYQKLGDFTGCSYMFGSIASMYYERGDYRRALAYNDSTISAARQAIAAGNERHVTIGSVYGFRGELYKQMGLLDSALANKEKGYSLELALKETEVRDKVAEVDARYQNQAKQEQIEEQESSLRLKNNQLLMSSTIGLLVLTLAGGLFVGYRRQRAAKENLRTQNALIQQQATQLKALDAAKTRLFTNISHEFRTPLTVINGLAAQLGQTTNGSTKEAATLIGRNGENLLRLVNQILDLAQIDNGAMPLHWVRGNAITYLQYLTESFYSVAQQKDIRLVFYAEQPEVLMDFDAGKTQQIITNLLSNALKFTPSLGKVVIHANVVSGTLANEQWLQVKVQDTGSGIAEHELPHIFDRFYQIDDSSTRRSDGTGIGLALVQELTTLLGGRIGVESRVGSGTTFTLAMPIRQHNPAASLWESIHTLPNGGAPYVPAPATYPALPTSTADKPLLLLIEDNADVATYISGLLQRDYKIEWANNGRVGIERAWATVPDIIISDVMMPERDGYEVCDTLKTDERSSHIPIILLTAKATQADKLTGLKTGADAYLEKPFQTDELFVRLNNLITLRKRLQEKYSQTIRLTTPLPKSAPVRDEVSPAPTLDEQFLAKIDKVIADHLDNPDLGIGHLCAATNLSNTQVFRKLKALTGLNPTLYVRRQRLERAMGLLRNPALNIAEIAYAVGFADPNYFSRAFAENFGHSPDALRKRLTISVK